jgi:pimeloyl-ACP methyl ester carboxylesterase
MTSTSVSSPRLGYDRYWMWRGWRIHYCYLRPRSPSSSPPLLFVHGFGAALGHWRNNLQVLSESHPVYALDLLGFGRSQKAGANYNPAFFAELLADFCDTFLQRPAILVGNSLGSVISLLTAHRYGDRVKGLVLINLPDTSLLSRSSLPSPQSIETHSRKAFPSFGDWIRYPLIFLLTSPLVINPLLAIVRSPAILFNALRNAYADPRWVDEELKALIQEPTQDPLAPLTLRCLTRGMGQVAPEDQARSTLPQMQIPILLIWGKQDRLVPPPLARRCATLNPRIQVVELDQAGHCPQDECSDRVNALILQWLMEN